MTEVKTYRGTRFVSVHDFDASLSTGVRGVCSVTVNGKPLHSLNEVGYIEPFEWGCKNSASRNLAESLLFDYLNGTPIVEELTLFFLNDVISRLGFDGWVMEEFELVDWLSYALETLETELDDDDKKDL